MLNIEKYKNELSKDFDTLDCQICALRKKGNCKLGDHCDECRAENIKWLCSEYKEPLLDDEEKKYLSAVIEPFRKSVISIKKLEATYGWEIISFYYTFQSYGCITILPPFQSGTRFKDMELGKEYMCEELGL